MRSSFLPFRRWLTAPALLALLLAARPAAAQQFWRTTATFPGGLKIALTSRADSSLLTTGWAGVLHSPDGGRSWTPTLPARGVGCFAHTRAGLVLAGGIGHLYRSPDGGLTWDSVVVPTSYPLTAIVETPTGLLLAATGTLDLAAGYIGSGVLASADGGLTWQPRNQGFTAAPFVERLVQDAHGRLYAALTDDMSSQGGLYTSDDEGRSWQHVPVRINGRGTISDDITAYRLTALTVTPTDSVVCSLEGVAVNVAVQLNLIKPRTALHTPTPWRLLHLGFASTWWMEPLLHNLYVARNGDWYSAREASTAAGGTLRSTNQGRTWQRITQGLGTDVTGRFGPQTFTEAGNGRLYMVQRLDEQVYWTDASRPMATAPDAPAPLITLAPNPAPDAVRLTWPTAGPAPRRLWLTDLTGRLVAAPPVVTDGATATLDLRGLPAGTYLLHAAFPGATVVRRLSH